MVELPEPDHDKAFAEIAGPDLPAFLRSDLKIAYMSGWLEGASPPSRLSCIRNLPRSAGCSPANRSTIGKSGLTTGLALSKLGWTDMASSAICGLAKDRRRQRKSAAQFDALICTR